MVKKMTPRDCALLGLGAVGIVGICYGVKAVVSIVAEKMS